MKGQIVLSDVDYSLGIAHCPSCERFGNDRSVEAREAINEEIETGRDCSRRLTVWARPFIKPPSAGVIASLLTDSSDVINYRSFTEWCDATGMSDDSIKARQTYDACLEIALHMRHLPQFHVLQALARQL